ncbi:MAG: glycosyltransferase family 4 protein [Acidimicrobiia bacterium]
MTTIRVLAVIVLPPHLKVSGAARAGERLSYELAAFDDIEIEIANMAGHVGEYVPSDSDIRISRSRPLRHAVRTMNPLARLPFVPNRLRTPLYLSDIPKLIRRGGYDVVHIHNPTPSIAMWRVARACRRAKVPYVVSTHGFVEIADGSRINAMGLLSRIAWSALIVHPVRAVVQDATRMLLLSPADADPVERLGGGSVPTSIVSNGVDVTQCTGEPAHPASVPTGGEAGLRAFFLANHTPNKGIGVLLDAFAALDEPFTLVVGGERRSFVDYESAAARCKPGQRIIVTGSLPQEEVDALFEWADLFVFPTLADTLPLVVLEAMAHGTAVVASAVGGIPYELEGGCGVIVPPGDAPALAAAIRGLADDMSSRRTMGMAGAERVRSHFTWPAAARAARGAYYDTLGIERPSVVEPEVDIARS